MSHALTVPTHDRITAVTLQLLDHIFSPPRAFDIRLWNGLTLPASGRSSFVLVLRHPATLRRMFSPPVERSLGESFIYGDYDLEGDLIAAFTLFHVIFERPRSPRIVLDVGHDLLTLPRAGPVRPIGRGRARLSGVKHSLARDRAAVQYHYDYDHCSAVVNEGAEGSRQETRHETQDQRYVLRFDHDRSRRL